MNLDEIVRQKLAEWRPNSGRQTLTGADAACGWTVAVTAERVETVGCQLWELSLRRAAASPAIDIRARAEEISRRVTGLLEPLHVLEVDQGRNVALLRSEQPGQHGESRFYYEVMVEGNGSASVRRYQAPQQGEPRRQQIVFTLTHEALTKLVRDLTTD